MQIGNTPLVALQGIYAKLEWYNPTGSAKDRAALYMVTDAENRGLLAPGGTLLEPTSGNMGISLAALGARRGYRVVILMPDCMSIERQMLMRAYGAEVILTPGPMANAIEKARQLAKEIPGSFLPGQFDNPANPLAHYCTTGPEIWRQMAGKVDIFLCAVGTGGTLTGAGRYLKEQNPRLQIVALEPAASPVLSGGPAGSHGIQGIGAGFLPGILDTTLIDRVVQISDTQALTAARHLARTEGLLCGISSGAALHAAWQAAADNPGKRIVTILPDGGERYLSGGLFSQETR